MNYFNRMCFFAFCSIFLNVLFQSSDVRADSSVVLNNARFDKFSAEWEPDRRQLFIWMGKSSDGVTDQTVKKSSPLAFSFRFKPGTERLSVQAVQEYYVYLFQTPPWMKWGSPNKQFIVQRSPMPKAPGYEFHPSEGKVPIGIKKLDGELRAGANVMFSFTGTDLAPSKDLTFVYQFENLSIPLTVKKASSSKKSSS